LHFSVELSHLTLLQLDKFIFHKFFFKALARLKNAKNAELTNKILNAQPILESTIKETLDSTRISHVLIT